MKKKSVGVDGEKKRKNVVVENPTVEVIVVLVVEVIEASVDTVVDMGLEENFKKTF